MWLTLVKNKYTYQSSVVYTINTGLVYHSEEKQRSHLSHIGKERHRKRHGWLAAQASFDRNPVNDAYPAAGTCFSTADVDHLMKEKY